MDHELAAQHVVLMEGMAVSLYDSDLDEAGHPILIVIDGVAHFDANGHGWYAVIEEGTLREEPNADRPWRWHPS